MRESLEGLLQQAEEQRLVPLVRSTTQQAVESRMSQLWSPLLSEVRKAAQEAARNEFQAQHPLLEQKAAAAGLEAAREAAEASRPQRQPTEAEQRAAVGQEVDNRLSRALEGPQLQERVQALVQQTLEQVREEATRAAVAAAEQRVDSRVREAVEAAAGGIETRLLQAAEGQTRQLLEQSPPPAAPSPGAPGALWAVAGLGLVLGAAALALALL